MRRTLLFRQAKLTVMLAAVAISLGPGIDSRAAAQNAGTPSKANSKSAANSPAAEVPPFLNAAQAARPLPATKDPAQYADSRVAGAYRIARNIPTVIAQQPCFCWCSRGGHRSLLDCYVDDHASFCDICMKEALLAGRMHRQGKSPAAIRAAIVNGDWRDL